MKSSEVIDKLQKLIDEYGDLEVMADYAFEGCEDMEIVDIFVKSDGKEIFFKIEAG